MATSPPRDRDARDGESAKSEHAGRGQAERVFVLAIVGAVLAALVIVGLTLIVSGRLHRLTEIARAQTDAVEALQQRIAAIERQRAAPSAAAPVAPASSATSRPTTQAMLRELAVRQAELLARLERHLTIDADGEPVLADPTAARRARDELLALVRPTDAPPPMVVALASVSALLGDDDLARDLIAVAAERRAPIGPAVMLAASRAVAAGELDWAQEFADRLAGSAADATTYKLLCAEIAAARGDVVEVDAQLVALRDVADSLRMRLRVAKLLIEREQFGQAERVLHDESAANLRRSPVARRLSAILLAARGNPDEALAAIDALLDESPDDSSLRVWRGAALVRGRQFASARAALGSVPVSGEATTATYWRVRIEIDSGDATAARRLLDQAPESAAILELRARLSLEASPSDERAARAAIAEAITALERATQVDSGRGSAHLLLAIAYAKVDRAEEARRSVKRAVEIDPAWLDAALAAEVITRVVSPAQLREWAGA
ncbi:MAG: tetratricopeptide repeat protein [Phycisphaerae bacterium]